MASTTVTLGLEPSLRARARARPLALALALAGCGGETVIGDGPPETGAMMSDVNLPDAGGESGFVGAGPPCDGSAGAVPAPNCFPSTGASPVPTAVSCATSTSGTCSLGSVSACGTTDCLPMTTNKAPIYNFRMSQLTIQAPSILAGSLIQDNIVTAAVTLNAPTCGYGPIGMSTGAFNWLLQVDKTANTLKTGGGGPVTDPYTTGYCFVNENSGSGNTVTPITVPITFNGNAFSTTQHYSGLLFVPIFLSRTMLTTSIILPLRGARFSDVGISPDGNCIGDLNPEWAGAAGTACSTMLPASCPKWFTNGAFAGYMTLMDANLVPVPSLGSAATLCGLLVGKAGSACTPADYSSGDFDCSTSPQGATRCESVWFSATFAANAVKINDSTAPPCGP
jgi:hypothetical protein